MKKVHFFSKIAILTLGIIAPFFSLYAEINTTHESNNSQEKSVTFDSSIAKKRYRSNARRWRIFSNTFLRYEEQFLRSAVSTSSANIGIRTVEFGYSDITPHKQRYGTLGIKGSHITDDQWTWNGLAQIEIPLKTVSSITGDSRIVCGFEGSYRLNKDLSLLVGLSAQTGIRATNVQPILGAEYRWNGWIFQAVYPTPKIIYKGIQQWQFSWSINPIFTAMRTKKVGHNRKGILLMKGASQELNAEYAITNKTNILFSIGNICRAKITTGNSNFHHRSTQKISTLTFAQIGLIYKI